METRLLELFVAVVHQGSFAAVARSLNIDPSSVSRSIAMLEREFNAQLFHRTTRQLALTEAGNRLLLRIEPILSELDQAKDDTLAEQTQPSGLLRLSTSVAFGQTCIIPHIEEFISAYPNINLQLQLTDIPVDLISDQIDLAIRLAPGIDDNLKYQKLIATHYRVCASPNYLKQYGIPDTPQQLQGHACLCFMLNNFKSRWLFRKTDNKPISVPISPRLVISNALALKQTALLGLGPVLLANWMIQQELKDGTLVDLFPAYQVTATHFDTAAWLVHPHRSFLPQKTRVLIAFLKDTLRR